MRITSKGQVTIPQQIREQLGLLPNTEVEFVVRGNSLRIVKAQSNRRTVRGKRAVQLLRRSGQQVHLSTDHIMKLTRGD